VFKKMKYHISTPLAFVVSDARYRQGHLAIQS
jgi:hypothetical protein